ncbi:hypothetical protein FQA39_LY18295 [Lamprigera yunnana]|nr:hypothetical protein FQA39_LY18295 [Lamprigera yunnana]
MCRNLLLKLNVQYATICLLLPPDTKKFNAVLLKIHTFLRYFTLLLLYSVWLPFVYEMWLQEKTKFVEYTLTIINTGAYLCSILTMHFFLKNGTRGRKMVEELNHIFQYTSDGVIAVTSMSRIDKLTKKFTYAFLSLLSSGVITMSFIPIFMKGRNLPLPGEFFGMDVVNNTAHYVGIYVLQTVGQVQIGHITAASDTLYFCMVLVSGEQIIILATNFHNCLYNALINCGVDKNTVLAFKKQIRNGCNSQSIKEKSIVRDVTGEHDIPSIMESKRFKDDLINLMISYIKDHQNTVTFFKKLDSFFLPVIFMKVCVSMFYHVFITFAMLSSSETGMILTLAEYEVCAVAELFLFALAGQSLYNKVSTILVSQLRLLLI